MAQARRKTPAKKKPSKGSSASSVVMLLAGVVIGSLGTILWQGMRTSEGEIGAGIRKMMEQSRVEDQNSTEQETVTDSVKPVKQETNFDFYTVLPEIEVVVPDTEPEKPKGVKEQANNDQTKKADSGPEVVDKSPEVSDSSAYMLQAGSYQKQSDADKLKAQLGLMGFGSTIQKVSIQGRGDFYRVRLGPYTSHDQMEKADKRLSANGIQALRLKISRGG
jgi:cell division protein FtsN